MIEPTLGMAVEAVLERAINAALALDPRTMEQLGTLEGRVIALSFDGTGITLYMQPTRQALRIASQFDGEPDTVISGPPLALVRMAAGDRKAGLFTGEIHFRGDVELGQRFQRILGELDFDWEEHLSRLTGDAVAHRLGTLVRGFAGWARQAGETVGRDMAEYLSEEADALPPKRDAREFMEAVDQVREAVDRLEARIRHLERKTD